MVNNAAVANLIREGKTFQIPSTMQTGKREGMQVLDSVLLDAVKAGDVKGEDAWEFANDKNLFLQWAPKGSPVLGGPPPGIQSTGLPSPSQQQPAGQPRPPGVIPGGQRKAG